VSAWLDGDQPRSFWGLLALGFPLGLLGSAIGLAQTAAMLTPAPSGLASDAAFLVPTALGPLVGSVATLLALAAYARWAPAEPGNRASSLIPAAALLSGAGSPRPRTRPTGPSGQGGRRFRGILMPPTNA
jgi:hypothetical protein